MVTVNDVLAIYSQEQQEAMKCLIDANCEALTRPNDCLPRPLVTERGGKTRDIPQQ